MASYAEGTYTPGATGTSWNTVDGSNTDAGWFSLIVDWSNLVAGETVEWRITTTILSGGTERQAVVAPAHGAQDSLLLIFPVPCRYDWSIEMRQLNGTARAFPWRCERATLT